MKKKIIITIITLILAIFLTFLSSVIIPLGERVSSGYRLPGFPLGFFEAYGGGEVQGAFNTRFLIFPFLIDLLCWVIISILLFLLVRFINKTIKK